MKHRARVLQDASAGSLAQVAIDGVSACQRCANGEGCGAGLFNQGIQSVQLECRTVQAVRAQQTVMVEHDDADSGWLWVVAGAYGLPTLGLLIACLLAEWFLPVSAVVTNHPVLPGPREWLTGLVSLLGLAGGVIAWRTVAPYTQALVQTGPCLQSARIVAVDESSLTPSPES